MADLYWIRTSEMTDMFSQGYIGISEVSATKRWVSHKSAAKDASKAHLPIYRAIAKYGFDYLIKTVLVEGEISYIQELEEKLRPAPGIGWNCAVGGQATGKGRIHSEEEKSKRSAARKGYVHSEETKIKMSVASKGKPKSEAHRAKMAVANLGRIRSEECKLAQSIKMTGLAKITEEGRKRLSDIKKALPRWCHSQANISIWFYAQAIRNSIVSDKVSNRLISGMFGVKDSTTASLSELLNTGWIPELDAAWLSWKDSVEGIPELKGTWKVGDPAPSFKERKKAVFEAKQPWEGVRANLNNWSNCEIIQDMLLRGDKPLTICNYLGLNSLEKPLDTIFKKLKSGWQPKEDAAYQDWLKTYEKEPV